MDQLNQQQQQSWIDLLQHLSHGFVLRVDQFMEGVIEKVPSVLNSPGRSRVYALVISLGTREWESAQLQDMRTVTPRVATVQIPGHSNGHIELYSIPDKENREHLPQEQPCPEDTKNHLVQQPLVSTTEQILHTVAQYIAQVLNQQSASLDRDWYNQSSGDLLGVFSAGDLSFEQVHQHTNWEACLGWSREDIENSTWDCWLHPEDKQLALEYVERLREGNYGSKQETLTARYLCKDNSTRWVRWSFQLQPKGSILISGRDITTVTLKEFEHRKNKVFLNESQQIAQLGIWELDLRTNILLWSDEIYRIFQIDKNKFEASYEAFLNAVHPDDRGFVNTSYINSLKTREPYNIVHRLQFPSGSIKYVNEICRNEYDEKGRPTRSVGIVQDVTKLTLAQEDLRKAKIRAESADRLKTTFLANMSHECRTPLNAVVGFTDILLMDGTNLSEQQKEYLKTIKDSGNMLLNLINDILDISKIEADQLHLEKRAFSLLEVLKTVASHAEVLKNRMKKDVGLHVGPEFCDERVGNAILGDPFRLQQVLDNLMSNAIKFTDAGSIECSVNMLVTPDFEKILEFRVKDSGIGIPIDKQGEIFESFKQAHYDYNKRGTGLGLAIAKKVVDMMGGRICVQSTSHGPNHGSVFTVTIPYVPAASAETDISDRAPEKATWLGSQDLEGKTVLVVDDNIVNLKLARMFVRKMGCLCRTAENGKEAVTLFQSDPSIDLILLDKEMPIMDGLDAVRTIRDIERKDNNSRRIPVVACTASAMNGDREECIAAGCDDFITKPLDACSLEQKLSLYIGKTNN